jgi:hypothetical protein
MHYFVEEEKREKRANLIDSNPLFFPSVSVLSLICLLICKSLGDRGFYSNNMMRILKTSLFLVPQGFKSASASFQLGVFKYTFYKYLI